MKLCVGLFGTCGGSQWRVPFKAAYDSAGITYFDPQKEDWKPEDADEEAGHLAEDAIILFPITGETYAMGSLAESGFSVLSALKLDDRRDIVVFIDQNLNESLLEDKVRAKDSQRARALVKAHLKKVRLRNVYVVDSLEEMQELSILLWQAAKVALDPAVAKFSTAERFP